MEQGTNIKIIGTYTYIYYIRLVLKIKAIYHPTIYE